MAIFLSLIQLIIYSLGYYCYGNSTDYVDKPCPVGHYCPEGTADPMMFACPVGTFNPLTMEVNDSACLPCTPGMYCMTSGLENPTGNCRYILHLSYTVEPCLEKPPYWRQQCGLSRQVVYGGRFSLC